MQILVALPALRYDSLGFIKTLPTLHLDGSSLQLFVDFKEVLDFGQDMGRNIVETTHLFVSGAALGDCQDLVIVFRFLQHVQHADRPHSNQAAGKAGLFD